MSSDSLENFEKTHFSYGEIAFCIDIPIDDLVSVGSKSEKKEKFKSYIRRVTKQSNYIFTNSIYVFIDIHQSRYDRLTMINSIDLDNLGKPILDALSGKEGLFVDDCLIDRLMVNWLDIETKNIKIDIEIKSMRDFFNEKNSLCYIKFENWCLPCDRIVISNDKLINKTITLYKDYFFLWSSINKLPSYMWNLLPQMRFIPFSKLKNSGFEIIELNDMEKDVSHIYNFDVISPLKEMILLHLNDQHLNPEP